MMKGSAFGWGSKRFARLLSLVLVILMFCSLVPVGALAADDMEQPTGDSIAGLAAGAGAESDPTLEEVSYEPPAQEEPAPAQEEPAAEPEDPDPAPADPAEEPEDPADEDDDLPPDAGETPTGDNIVPVEEGEMEDVEAPTEENAPASETMMDLVEDYKPPLHFEADCNGLTVIVDAPEGTLPFGTGMRVAPVLDNEVLQTIGDEVGADARQVTAVDISFRYQDEEIEPDGYIFVTLKSQVIEASTDAQVVHMDNYGNTQVVDQYANPASDELSFVADSFSVYAVVGDDVVEEESRMTLNFYNGSTLLATVYVKNGDDDDADLEQIIYDPGVGVLNAAELFKGWSLDEADYGTDDAENAMDIEQIRAWAKGLANSDSITEGDVHNFYAMIYKTYSVVFKDEDGATVHGEALIFKNDENPSYLVNVEYTPKDEDSNFQGWYWNSAGDDVTNEDGSAAPTIIPNGTTVKVNSDTVFSANPATGFWLSFNENGSGASYTPPQFVEEGHVTEEPAEPTRNGYDFGGWYETADCSGDPFTFGQELSGRTRLYAKWTPKADAGYTLIVWQQSASDRYDAADADKTYDYAFSTTLSAASNTAIGDLDLSAYVNKDGQTITVDGKDYSFYGFKYNTTRGPVSTETVVQPNGTTVVNLYYDREVVTFDFMVRNGYTQATPNWNSGTTYYYRANGNYYPCSHSGNTTYYYVPFTGTKNNNTTYYVNIGGEWYPYSRVYIGTWPFGEYQWVLEYDGSYYVWDGPIYTRNQAPRNATYYVENWESRETYTGLYGQKLTKYDYEWPTDYRWFNEIDGNTFTSIMDMFGASVNENPDSPFHSNYYGYTQNFDTNVYHYLQEVDDSWPTSPTYTIPTVVGNGMVFRNFQGFTASEFRIKLPSGVYQYQTGTSYNGDNLNNPTTHYTSDGWTDWLPYGTGVEYTGNTNHETTRWAATEGGIEFRYERNEYKLSYLVGRFVSPSGEVLESPITGTLHEESDIPFEGSLSGYGEAYTPAKQTGYVFDGWYIDETCTTPMDFENSTMPLNGVTVYGKWVQKEYRVFLHPNADLDASLNWGDQNMSFRVGEGEKIAGGNKIIGTRDDYELVGWYTDPACTKPFNFDAFVMNERNVTTPYDQTEDTELDRFGNPTEQRNKDAENNRYWIDTKLDLYAKWRAKLEGAKGISVIYQADASSSVTGHFAGGDKTYTDPLTYYLDRAEANATAASIPDDTDTYQFMYWVVQRWDESANAYVDTETTVYPGDTFEVLKAYARVQDIPGATDPDNNKTYTVQLRAEYREKDAPTPTHINWYDNNHKNGTYTDSTTPDVTNTDLQINEAVDIARIPSYPGYIFLGWARIDEGDVNGYPTAWEDMTEAQKDKFRNNMFLTYHEDTNTYTAKINGADTTVTQVAADEELPYHDLYAVWQRVYTVNVRKLVSGNMGDVNRSFTITVTADKDVTYNNAVVTAGTATTLTLKSGQTSDDFTKIPENTKFTVTETAVEGYDVSYSYFPTDNTIEPTSFGATAPSNFEITADGTFVVTNNKDVTVDTAVSLDSLPFILIITLTVLSSAAMLVSYKRRRGNER